MESYWLNWLHLLAAMVWVGGSLSIPLVIMPVLRRHVAADRRIQLVTALGMRFRTVGWIALLVLILTGVRRTMIALSSNPDPWGALGTTAWGRTLTTKLVVVGLLLLLQILHDFVLGPRVRRLAAGESSPGLARARRATIGLGMAGLLLTLVVVTLAAILRYR